MNIFFNKKQKTPTDLVKSIKESLIIIEKSGPNSRNTEKALEELSKCLTDIKKILYGDAEHEPNQENATILATEICSSDLLSMIIRDLGKLEFEAKKDFAQIFNNLLRIKSGARSPTVDYIAKNPDLLNSLVKGYEQQDIALNCGTMLRECIKHENLAKELLYSQNFWVFERYTVLLNSQNYVTRRQSIKLLGELLLDRSNFNIMTKYISSAVNLKLMMNLLRDKSKSIQYEAFHVFKVFVANPKQNQTNSGYPFEKQRETYKEDQFNDEKAFLLKQIQAIPTD
ncbi:Mo25-like family protein [Heterostelium album PN500]|uniref:Mo25-like family protein n=1 Tax=Heterostelium pallidum (strain ATCC 26659 / Pp 5 / PN500) TaxID=670386 RepID=D3BAI7_HETP5|nr:Mo25-like family protein [Heterostelium album PN500]EFA81574.1 Mo25-like family protein [Heterostelium album PN500]|eukprot:XP_020433691.1 Mo25-like family protein [Heterostelium album PN500]